jgi:hypothetical protein
MRQGRALLLKRQAAVLSSAAGSRSYEPESDEDYGGSALLAMSTLLW